ncbi:hypothetical protein FKW77_001995 [Venturia effusa]|uniref:Uncharacterized protein n=1 Tax=Venturia effusa TaxID=50376 RepID=A0A517LMA8_9PEZI|nr:hypothetical protein FKW77_001995 [Venturia effusa]
MSSVLISRAPCISSNIQPAKELQGGRRSIAAIGNDLGSSRSTRELISDDPELMHGAFYIHGIVPSSDAKGRSCLHSPWIFGERYGISMAHAPGNHDDIMLRQGDMVTWSRWQLNHMDDGLNTIENEAKVFFTGLDLQVQMLEPFLDTRFRNTIFRLAGLTSLRLRTPS